MLRVVIAILGLGRCGPPPLTIEVAAATTALPHAQHTLTALDASILDGLVRDVRVEVHADAAVRVEPVVVELTAVPNGRHGMKVACRVDAHGVTAAAAVTTSPLAADIADGEIECVEIAGFDLANRLVSDGWGKARAASSISGTGWSVASATAATGSSTRRATSRPASRSR